MTMFGKTAERLNEAGSVLGLGALRHETCCRNEAVILQGSYASKPERRT